MLPSHIMYSLPPKQNLCVLILANNVNLRLIKKYADFIRHHIFLGHNPKLFPHKQWIVDRLLACEYSRPSSSPKKRPFSLAFLFSCLLLFFFLFSAPHFTLLSSLSARLLSRVRYPPNLHWLNYYILTTISVG